MTNFFKWGRNPFKLWRSYIGAIIPLFIPIPLGGRIHFVGEIFSNVFINGFSPLVFLLFVFPIMLSGFFFGASTKKGRDNFVQYGALFLGIQVLIYLWVISLLSGFT